MAVKIRLRKQGRTHRPFYRLVATDVRNPRDGRCVEILGWYNPFGTEPETNLNVKEDRIHYWIGQGAVLSERAESLIARAAPAIVKKLHEKKVAQKAKNIQKRKARKSAAAK